MRITVEIPDELASPMIQEHLDSGRAVQDYIKSAVAFYTYCKTVEQAGEAIGTGEPSRMRSYHRVIQTKEF